MANGCRLFQDAVDYCQHVQDTRLNYINQRLDWVIERAFCWHSLAIMLTTVLRNHAISNTPEAKWARQRITEIFRDRPSIDYLKGNDTLWEPLERLRSELELRQLDDVDLQQQPDWESQMAGVDWNWTDDVLPEESL